MKEGRQYKRERIHREGDREKERKNSVTTGTRLIIKFKRDIYKNTYPRIGPMTIFCG